MTETSSSPSSRRDRSTYRRRTKEEKRGIVEETFAPGASVSIVARRHDVNANQVFTWRKQYQRGELGGSPVQACPGFLPVGVIGHDGLLVTEREKPVAVSPSVVVKAAAPPQPVITLSLREGVQVRLEGDVGLSTLRCVLKTVLGQS